MLGRVKGLVLFEPTPDVMPAGYKFHFNPLTTITGIFHVSATGLLALMKRDRERRVEIVADRATRSYKKFLTEPQVELVRDVLKANMGIRSHPVTGKPPWMERIRNIQQPVIVVAGSQTVDLQAAIVANIPRGRLVRMTTTLRNSLAGELSTGHRNSR